MRLIDKNSGGILAEEVEIADSFWSRLRGLMFRSKFEWEKALLFRFSEPRKFRIHTFFVFFPIDLIYLDQYLKVQELVRGLSSWRVHSPEVTAKFLIELPEGKIDNARVEVGDKIELQEAPKY